MEHKIKKAKLTKTSQLEIDLLEILPDKSERLHPGIKCDQLVHPDLKKAFARLTFHLAHLCDLKESALMKEHEGFDPELYPSLAVSTFIITGDEEKEGVSLVGTKTMLGNKVLNLNSPNQLLSEDYQFSSELGLDIEACVYEVHEYYFNEKYALKQEKIEFPEDGDDQVAKPAKKTGKKKILEKIVHENEPVEVIID